MNLLILLPYICIYKDDIGDRRYIMTQAHVDWEKEQKHCDFVDLESNLLKKEITCTLDGDTKIVIKKRGKKTLIHLISRGKKLSLSESNWTKLCALQQSVSFLHSFLDEH